MGFASNNNLNSRIKTKAFPPCSTQNNNKKIILKQAYSLPALNSSKLQSWKVASTFMWEIGKISSCGQTALCLSAQPGSIHLSLLYGIRSCLPLPSTPPASGSHISPLWRTQQLLLLSSITLWGAWADKQITSSPPGSQKPNGTSAEVWHVW